MVLTKIRETREIKSMLLILSQSKLLYNMINLFYTNTLNIKSLSSNYLLICFVIIQNLLVFYFSQHPYIRRRF